jgi:hypothetical protein
VPVPMMDIRVVRMEMDQFRVMMNMRMWFARRIGGLMNMLVVLVVPVEMFMGHCFMPMRVSVALSQVEPDAHDH